MVGASILSKETQLWDATLEENKLEEKKELVYIQRLRKPCSGCQKIFVAVSKENSVDFAKSPYFCRNCRKVLPQSYNWRNSLKNFKKPSNSFVNQLFETCSAKISDEPLSFAKKLMDYKISKHDLPSSTDFLQKKLNKATIKRKQISSPNLKSSPNKRYKFNKHLKMTTEVLIPPLVKHSDSPVPDLESEITPSSTKSPRHIDSVVKLHCDICNLKFRSRKKLRFHSQRHKIIGNFSCPYCPSYFRVKGALGNHVVHIHRLCNICSKSFDSYDDLLLHKFENHAENWWSMEPLDDENKSELTKRNSHVGQHILRGKKSDTKSMIKENNLDFSSDSLPLEASHKKETHSFEQRAKKVKRNVSKLFTERDADENVSELECRNISDSEVSLLDDNTLKDDGSSSCACSGNLYHEELFQLRKNIGILLSKFCQKDLMVALKPDDNSIDKFVMKLIALSEGKDEFKV